MSLTLEEYRARLVTKILLAGSQEEVKRFVSAAMKGLEQHKVNGHIISRFVDKMINDLEQFTPMKEDAQQWSNIQMARILFHRIKREPEVSPSHKDK